MKLFSMLVTILASAAALATPAVGDYAKFDVKIEQNGAYMLGTYEVSILSKDESTGQFKMKTVVSMEDQTPQSREKYVDASDFINDQTINKVLANCAGYGGKLSSYTISNFTTTTCVVPTQDDEGTEDGEVHVALVPLGLVKQVQKDSAGRTTSLLLTAFTKGK